MSCHDNSDKDLDGKAHLQILNIEDQSILIMISILWSSIFDPEPESQLVIFNSVNFKVKPV